MRSNRSLFLTAALVLLAAALAGCASSDTGGDGPAAPVREANCVEGDALLVEVSVDNARPEPGDEAQFTLSLTNAGDEAAAVPGNFTLQVVDPNGTLLAEAPHVEPRFDMPSTVAPNETVFLTRESLLIPGGAEPGTFRACVNGGEWHGVTPFLVYGPEASGNGTGDGGGGAAVAAD